MEITCPYCKRNFATTTSAKPLKNERLSLTLKYEGDSIEAKTIGKTIVNFENVLQSMAKELGNKIYVGFGGIESKEKEITIKFLVLPRKGDK